VEGGVAASWFGSEADFSRLLVKNSTYRTFFRNHSTGQGFVFARSTTVGVENPLGSTVLLDPAQTPTAAETLIPLPSAFITEGQLQSRIRVKSGRAPRSLHGVSVGGSALFLNNLEMRFPNVRVPYLNDNIGFTLFEDMGNVFARPQEMLPSMGRFHQPNRQICFQAPPFGQLSQCSYNYASHAVGIGVRYQTPIGRCGSISDTI